MRMVGSGFLSGGLCTVGGILVRVEGFAGFFDSF